MHTYNANLQSLFAILVFLLALRYASSSYSALPNQPLNATCSTLDQPNPIASIYPTNATGTLNGTIAVVPIPLSLARNIIPSQYRILEHAYRALLPDFPKGMYPAMVQAMHDHDVQVFNFKVDDFSRAGFEFPFVDILGDNHTSFRWAPAMLLTAGHELAIKGAQDYGTNVFEAVFDPPCDAYKSVKHAPPGTTSWEGKSTESGAYVSTVFSPTRKEVFPFEFFKNFTNQPSFANGSTCDEMVRLFNTSVSAAPYGIQPVKGTVRANLPPFSGEKEWKNVYGLRLDSAFIENNYLDCRSLRSYAGRP
jgi:hypothetical protein